MPYFLYEQQPHRKNIYKRQSNIALFGYKQGLVYHAIESELQKASDDQKGLVWIRSVADVLSSRGYDSDKNIVVADLVPKPLEEIVMGVVCGIAGHTDKTWTPFMLLLRLIEKRGSAVEKMEINLDEAQTRCCTILYAQGGWDLAYRKYTAQGRGGITAALLGQTDFKHFMKTGLEWIENGKITTEARQDG